MAKVIDRSPKLNDRHRQFILHCLASFDTSPSSITRRLNDREEADRFCFKPVKVSVQAVHQAARRMSTDEIAVARARFLVQYDDAPFAHKKMRVLELTRLYEGVDKLTKTLKMGDVMTEVDISSLTKTRMKCEILNQIRVEMGEDMDKIADAIRSIKSENVLQVIFNSDAARERVEGALGAIFRRTD